MSRNEVFNSRFSDAPWLFKKDKPTITVGGAGGIGSWLLLFISRTDNYEEIFLYENDIIDETNMAGQFFDPSQINMPKNIAISNLMYQFSRSSRVNSLGLFAKDSPVSNITLTGLDNMKTRKEMFEAWKSLETRELFMDGRMIFEDGQIYTVTKDNEKKYEETLFDDDEVKNEACSLKATSHTGAHIASLMLAILNNYFTNKYFYKDDIRFVPFSYVFSFPSLLTEINV